MAALPVDHRGRTVAYRTSGRAERRPQAAKLRVPLVVENRYVKRLRQVLAAIHQEVEKALKEEGTGRQDAYHARSASLDVLGVQIKTAVRKPVGEAFDQMSEGVRKANRLALARIEVNDLRLGAEIARAREANIQLMAKAGETYINQVREVLDDPDTFGLRVEALAERLADRAEVSYSKAELIARDQTLKLNAAINETRQVNAGVDSYTWSTSHDERVRPEHAALDGQTFTWSSGGDPEEGNPGEAIQCRCVAIPIFD